MLRYWIAAAEWKGFGIRTLQKLLNNFSDMSEIFKSSYTELINLGVPAQVAIQRSEIDWSTIDNALLWAERSPNAIISYMDNQYPPQLRQINSPPLVLYLKGEKQHLAKPYLAIVGSRQPSALGRETAFAFAKSCGEVGLGVCSGLAYGVDAAAHEGIFATNASTIAVLGSGIEHIYPKKHLSLAAKVAQQGLIISEYLPHTAPNAAHFPHRNRIISGISLGVLVVEAALKSGSLITARMALEQGKEVFAVPGSIYNHLTRGCHQLIRQGAKLVESMQDIIEEWSGTVDIFKNPGQDVGQLWADVNNKMAHLSLQQQAIWQLLDDAACTLDQLLPMTELPLPVLRRELVHLELLGYARTVPGGYQRSWPHEVS